MFPLFLVNYLINPLDYENIRNPLSFLNISLTLHKVRLVKPKSYQTYDKNLKNK